MTTTRIENAAAGVREAAVGRLDEARAGLRRLQDRMRERARAADKAVRSHPYETIGLAGGTALALGLLIGLATRRS